MNYDMHVYRCIQVYKYVYICIIMCDVLYDVLILKKYDVISLTNLKHRLPS